MNLRPFTMLLIGLWLSNCAAAAEVAQRNTTTSMADEPINYGKAQASPVKPFRTDVVATFDTPWALAFLPNRTMLVTEKSGRLWLVTPAGKKMMVGGAPKVHYEGQGGLLFVATSPTFARDRQIYLTYAEPGPDGDGLALAKATLDVEGATPTLRALKVIWRQLPRGAGGQFGGYIAFSPDGQFLFLTCGERERFTPAQDSDQALGKILRLTLDGRPAPGNPGEGKSGGTSIAVFAPPDDTAAVPPTRSIRVNIPSPNLTPAEIWSSGHRNSYGLAFDSMGRLWETEMGPMGGDELNLIERGRNYGWPLVSYGANYDGTPIPNPAKRPDLAKPALYWTPVIAPAGLTFYKGDMFPQWRGSAFVGGLAATALIRIAFDGSRPRQAERWDMKARIRAVLTGPDGALWLLEDSEQGRLLRLTPRSLAPDSPKSRTYDKAN